MVTKKKTTAAKPAKPKAAKPKAKAVRKPAAWKAVAVAFDKALEAKPLKSGEVKVATPALDGLKQRAEEFTKGNMSGTLDRLWWNFRWQLKKTEDPKYAAVVAIGRMPMRAINGKAYLIITADEQAKAGEALKG